MASKRPVKILDFFKEFERFIRDSKTGRRLQINGKRLSAGTIASYTHSLNLVRRFCEREDRALRIRPVRWLNTQEMTVERNYWKRFYQGFTRYLYDECGYYDNYVGHSVKNIRVFFNYLNNERILGIGDFHKQFYIRKEDIAIFPLMPEELKFLIHDKPFEEKLKYRMKEVKDFFVFGCTVGLRFSDLNALKKGHIRQVNDQRYLVVRSRKTETDSLVKLPPYAVAIISKYGRYKSRLLPPFNIVNINKFIKRLLDLAGFTHPVQLTRMKRGESVPFKSINPALKQPRFCDVASTHTMRRTAITCCP